MVQGQFLKGGLALLLFNFFKVIIFYILKLFYSAKLCYTYEEKLLFSAYIILWKKVILSQSENEPVCMCKEGWCVRLGQEGGSLCKGGGIVWNCLKRGWNRKEGSGSKNVKKGRKAWLRSGFHKTGGWNPLMIYGILKIRKFPCTRSETPQKRSKNNWSSCLEVFYKKGVQVVGLNPVFKAYSSTGIFQWILQTF